MTNNTIRTTLAALASGLVVFTSAGPAFAQNADRIAQADTNGDGDIAWDEMVAMRASTFDRLDRNSDGFIDGEDRPRFGQAGRRFDEAIGELSNTADTDGDGRISKTELMNAPSPMFTSGDTDGDGVLSSEEIAVLRETARDR